ncbi:ABC transporter ATP-binding protein [Enterococcus timonensis]|uniref:ABC transporter ATP-binding protein n=1 Tax=Enterococcus timonensis TaxID=1852364 RepID=UPI0008DA889B|nr:ABC transporter ATP-binding protein [Enterococcus timonensis]
MSTSNNLVLSDLNVAIGGHDLIAQINLTLKKNKIYTVIGPSGTGKSTLLRVLAGLQKKTSGTMTINDQAFVPKDKMIALVPQNYGLLPWETAWQTVENSILIAQKKRHLTKAEKMTIELIFTSMQLTGLENAYPKQLSGGQQQRVSLARAFALSADLLLLDEPFSALDASTRESIQQVFYENWQKNPTTTIFVTHDIEEALLLGHKMVIMHDFPGTVKKVIDNPFANLKLDQRKASPDFFSTAQRLKKEIAPDENE